MDDWGQLLTLAKGSHSNSVTAFGKVSGSVLTFTHVNWRCHVEISLSKWSYSAEWLAVVAVSII